MSVPFTDPYSGADLQTLLDELTLAWSERRKVLQEPPYIPQADRDVQAAAYWAGIQGWIDSRRCHFVNHTAPPDLFTAEVFNELIELPNGWRRAVDWPESSASYSYGYVQPGDILGPWLIADLQRAFSAMKWTRHPIIWDTGLPHSAHGEYPITRGADRAFAENTAWAQFLTGSNPPREAPGNVHFQIYFYWGWKAGWDADLEQYVIRAQPQDLENLRDWAEEIDVALQEIKLGAFLCNLFGSPPNYVFHPMGNNYVEGFNLLDPEKSIPEVQLSAPIWPDGDVTVNHGFHTDHARTFYIAIWDFVNCNE